MQEKVERYHELKREIGRLWQCKKVLVIPMIIGALGTIGKGFRTWIRKIQMENYRDVMQKACLFGPAKIRKVLNTLGCVLQLAVKSVSFKRDSPSTDFNHSFAQIRSLDHWKPCLLGAAKIRKVLDTLGCVLQLAIQDFPTI